ncbi:MAG: M23 family peptidase [Pelagerythrobacter marensis]|nr:MAG: M23 family peptidase [Pelagerythrobacter marensis]
MAKRGHRGFGADKNGTGHLPAFHAARRILAACTAAFLAIAAQPALANSSSAEMAAPVREGQAAPLTGGDEQFQQLFASWGTPNAPSPVVTSGNSGGVSGIVGAPRMGVSIPSRMPLASARLSSDFGMRNHPVIGGRRAHKGIDLASPTGTPIYATADGTVDMAQANGAYGLYVQLDHGGALETRYAHMSRIAVAAGQRVRKGDILGYVGSTGRSTGPHLHYEVRVNGEAVNPIPYMVETEAQARLALAPGEGGMGGE